MSLLPRLHPRNSTRVRGFEGGLGNRLGGERILQDSMEMQRGA